MNYFDVIIIIPLIWGGYKGFKKGFIIEIASFIALGLAVWGGMKFSDTSAKYLSNAFNIAENVMPLISFAVTFILIVILVFTLAKMLQRIISMVALGFINKTAGAIFGMLKFGLILSVVINFTNVLNNQIEFIEPEMKQTSILYEPMEKVAQILIPSIKSIKFNEVINDSFEQEIKEDLEAISDSLLT